jgi:hypothetical protein
MSLHRRRVGARETEIKKSGAGAKTATIGEVDHIRFEIRLEAHPS